MLSKARLAWTDAVEARKRVGRWATVDAMNKADEKIARAQEKFKEAEAEKSAVYAGAQSCDFCAAAARARQTQENHL